MVSNDGSTSSYGYPYASMTSQVRLALLSSCRLKTYTGMGAHTGIFSVVSSVVLCIIYGCVILLILIMVELVLFC